jgi:hypothetical protein
VGDGGTAAVIGGSLGIASRGICSVVTSVLGFGVGGSERRNATMPSRSSSDMIWK